MEQDARIIDLEMWIEQNQNDVNDNSEDEKRDVDFLLEELTKL